MLPSSIRQTLLELQTNDLGLISLSRASARRVPANRIASDGLAKRSGQAACHRVPGARAHFLRDLNVMHASAMRALDVNIPGRSLPAHVIRWFVMFGAQEIVEFLEARLAG